MGFFLHVRIGDFGTVQINGTNRLRKPIFILLMNYKSQNYSYCSPLLLVG